MNVIVQADHIIPEEMAKIQNQVESRTVKTEMITNETTYSITSKISTTYHCKTCGAYGVLELKERSTEEKKELIIKVYQERSSMRGIERTFGISRQTLSAWLKEKANDLPPLEETLQPVDPEKIPVLEVDEL